jgi:hypothetical protein
MFEILFDELESLINDQELKELVKLIGQTLLHQNYLISGKHWIHIWNGLMSGWKTTSLFGTMINYIILRCVLAI